MKQKKNLLKVVHYFFNSTQQQVQNMRFEDIMLVKYLTKFLLHVHHYFYISYHYVL